MCVNIYLQDFHDSGFSAPLHLLPASSSSCFLLGKEQQVQSKGEVEFRCVYWLAFVELESKRFSNFQFRLYNL
jgi:hypothetical protein